MSHWNHRVLKKAFEDTDEVQYGVYEVFYNDAGEIYAHTNTPIELACETMEGLREYIEWCLKSLDDPILEYGKIKFASDDITDEDIKLTRT